MKVCPTLTSLGLCVVIAAPAAVGQSRLQSLIDRQIENLNTSELRLGAVSRLENLGKLVVPELRRRFHWQKRGDLTWQQKVDLLYVLGSVGQDGVAAMPELLSWLDETDEETIDQLLSTLSYLAPHLGDPELRDLDRAVRSFRSARFRPGYSLVRSLTQLGANPSIDRLIGSLRDHGTHSVAACRKICTLTGLETIDRERITYLIYERLRTVTTRKFVNQKRGASGLSGELAEAWLAVSGKAPDAVVARGLLTHQRPMQRLRAILWLDENGKDLPTEELCDLAVRIWDGDDRVAAAAAKAIGKLGRRGAFGLPPLLLMAEQHRAKRMRTAATTAAAAIGKAFAESDAPDNAWLSGAVALLAGKQATVPKAPPSKAGRRTLAEMMMVAAWNPPKRLAELLTFVDASKPDRDLVGMVYCWLQQKDPPLVDEALAWLARNAKHTTDVADELRHDHPSRRWQHFALWDMPRACRGTAIEATAWFACVDADDDDLADLLDSGNTRLQARALAELLLRPADKLQPLAQRLRALADMYHQQQLDLRIAGSERRRPQPYELSEPVRMLAVMALARIGKPAEEQNGLAALVRKHFSCSLEELPEVVADRERQDAMQQQIEVFEAMCREKLHVQKHLAWPKAGSQRQKR